MWPFSLSSRYKKYGHDQKRKKGFSPKKKTQHQHLTKEQVERRKGRIQSSVVRGFWVVVVVVVV